MYMIKSIKTLVKRIIDDDFFGMAAEMGFMFVIGIFPFLLFLMAFFGWLGKQTLIGKVLLFFHIIAPPQVSDLINSVLEEVLIFSQGRLMAFLGIIITLFLASNAVAVIIKGLNRAHNIIETRSFLVTRLISILMVFANAFVLFLSINLIIFGKIIIEILANFIHLPYELVNTILVLRWPISFLALFGVTYMNYYVLPDIKLASVSRRVSVACGTLFFCIFWLLGSWGFSIYIGNLNTYNRVYGSIGAFAMLMIWLYYTSLLILIGGEINSQVYHKIDKTGKKVANSLH